MLTTIPYATGNRRTPWPFLLVGIGIAQGLFGSLLLLLCVRILITLNHPLLSVQSRFDTLLLAFVGFGIIAAVAHILAVAMLPVRGNGRRRGQVVARASLWPLLLVGFAEAIDGVWGIYHSNDPFVGFGVALGIGVAVIAAAFVALAYVAARRLAATGAPRDE